MSDEANNCNVASDGAKVAAINAIHTLSGASKHVSPVDKAPTSPQ